MIAIVGGKGGCGKTTTTLALARVLTKRGTRARAIDLDAGMPNLHRMADVDREPSLTDLPTDANDAEAPTILRDERGVEIVPAPRALDDLDLPAAIDAVRPHRGVALLDCPAGAGPAATAPLREADAAIVVTTARTESLEDASKTVRMARSLGVPILGAIVTRTERVSASAEAELGVGTSIAVPHSRDPLGDDRVLDRYGRVAESIGSWRQHRRETACPTCGGVRASDSRPTRRRDRRSRRSRDRGDTRSSSRGGGALSDRT
ncbi:MinD/ParA family ATP-binding protein [Salinarchaeum chitinilyticum]